MDKNQTETSQQPQVVYVQTPKSRGTALLLTILFGPLGLLYISIAGGIILTLLAVLLSWTVIVPIICWVASIIWAVVGTKS